MNINGEKYNVSEKREQEIFEKACAQLQISTGLTIGLEKQVPIEETDYSVDIRPVLINQNVRTPLFIELKRNLTITKIGVLAQKFKRLQGKTLLIADYINPMMADRLKEMDIWFLDTVGNAYINDAPAFIFVKGNKPEQPIGKEQIRRAFKSTGLKVVYAFLCNHELVNAPYREIAHAADVSIGTVVWVMTDLKEMGYLVEMGKKGRRLKDLDRLIKRWVEAYPEQLKPKLHIGRFTSNKFNWWKNVELEEYGAYMGGEIAAEYLTDYLAPELQTVYVRENSQNLQLDFGMRRNPNGEITLLKTFWSVECDWTDKHIVHPILIYADLLATDDPRNVETAEIIYENEIARHLSEN